ncbi:MAG: type IV pilus twitching motility protein PilT [Nitrospinae bacterium]|nr:type IV pilus twitching motility protein PilT [Nitrospinota bacterium]
MAKIDAFFKLMNDQGASDLHMVAGQQPILRINGEMERVKYDILEDGDLKRLLYEIAPEHKIKIFEETGDVDFAHEIPDVSRYRANFFRQKSGIAAVFRRIPNQIPTFEELSLPPLTKKMAMINRGLVLVTGPTGSGKSTTLAAMIDYANRNRKGHIITVEDPIEFVHKSHGCVVNHREVGTHTSSFRAALRGALREDPDIILVGELRDLETIALAIEAADTGHLVFGTLHTPSASSTVDRIIDVFPANQQGQIRATLSEALKAVIAQNMFRRADGKGQVVAFEVLVNTPAVANLIREKKTFQIPSLIQTGKKFGMIPLDDAIYDHMKAGRITPLAAYDRAAEKQRFFQFLKEPPDIFG